MRAIVTGTGSIATRHLKNLRQLFPNAKLAVVARAGGAGLPIAMESIADERFTDLASALEIPADLGVVATPAPLHVEQAVRFVECGVPTLIEKPLAMKPFDCAALLALQKQDKVRIVVGYCLRYHPLFMTLQDRLAAGAIGRLYTIRAEVGQYLPDWRPGTDYRRSVTAQAGLGGGALMELSHEIDLVRAIADLPQLVTAVAVRISELELDVEDVAEIVTQHQSKYGDVVASIHLDLFRRVPYRFIRVDGDGGRMELDFVAGRLVTHVAGKDATTLSLPDGFILNDIYLAELRDLLCTQSPRVSLADGLDTLRIIEATKRAAREKRTIRL